MKVQTSQLLHRNLLNVDLWKIPHLENNDERSKFSKVLSKYTKCEPLKKSTFRKHKWKSDFLKIFIEFESSVDLWKIPLLENFEERSKFPRVSSECTKYRPLKNSTLGKSRWKSEFLKSFVVNVISVELWKIPLSENIDVRLNFSGVSSRMYWVWTSKKFHT